ncbi:MAG TPA: hypothetical protein VKK31_04765 [Thermoanaerobaculia bacterium]|nr:hypothetical protein [Thermoanaerobaculia bacterium]
MNEIAAADRQRGLILAAGLLWIGAWISFSRYALLDDALIHLRYAHMLLRSGFMTFDGTSFSYGTSSPLYVGLLAALSSVITGPLLPKAVSVVFYVLLLGTIVRFAREAEARQAGWVLLGLILISPMALRWLTDGMETSLAALLVVLLATRASRSGSGSGVADPLLSFALGAILVLTRIELSLAIFFAVAGALPLRRPDELLRRHLPLALGGLGSLAALRLLFGQVLPETALAKRTAAVSFWEALFQVERSTLSSLTLGAGLVALWMLSLVLGLRAADRRGRMALLTANLLFPCLIALIAARGQILHGVRYLLWVYLFLIAWNLRVPARPSGPGEPWPRGYRLWTVAAVLLALWAFEGRTVVRVLSARNRMLLAMRSDDLGRLRATTGAGFDIGFVAFFSQARILDFNGLVNGRGIAALEPVERLRQMSAAKPDFLFVTEPQMKSLAPFLDIDSYRVCHQYPAATLLADQIYFLATRPDRAGIAPCEKLARWP